MATITFFDPAEAKALQAAFDATFDPPYPRQWRTVSGAPIPDKFTMHHYDLADDSLTLINVAENDVTALVTLAHDMGIAIVLNKEPPP